MSHCINNESLFENLISIEEKLMTAGEFLQITERGTAKITLSNSSTARLADVLMVLNIEMNLLFTQVLLTFGIENHQQVDRIDFH